MATRGRHARDDGQKEFTGRVHHWSYAWVTSKQPKTKELKFRRWQQTDERLPELAGPRHSYIEPVKDPDAKPYPRMVAPVSGGGAMPVSAAMGMKRGKSQAALNGTGGAAPAAQAPAAPAPPAPKIKLKFTLGQRLDQATAGVDAISGFVANPAGQAPAAAGAAAAGNRAAAAPAAVAGAPPQGPAAGAAALQSVAPPPGVAAAPLQQHQTQPQGQPGWPHGVAAAPQQQGPPAGGAPLQGQPYSRPPV